MSRTRCPNGTRKNKSGECISISQNKNGKTTTRKRCPKGTQKNKSGVCVGREQSVMLSPQTPRTKYAKTFFSNKPIVMLDKLNTGDKEVVFQVGFDDPKQFKKYTNLTPNPGIDCFYQSLFSLGLRKAETAKKETYEINIKGVEGINASDIAKYLTHSFNLKTPQFIEYVLLEIKHPDNKTIKDNKLANKTITQFFQDNLKNNHASIFTIKLFYEKHNIIGGHALVVYKFKNKIYFFDPQHKGIHNDKLVNSTSLLNIINYYKNPLVFRFGHFVAHHINNPIILKNSECPIPYVG